MATEEKTLRKKAGDLTISVKGVILVKRRLVLLRQPDGLWELPGGKLERRESLISGLRREVREETGVKIKQPRYLNHWVRTKDDGDLRFVVSYLCQPTRAFSDKDLDLSEEHVDGGLFTPDEALKMNLLDGYEKTIRQALDL